MKYLLFFLLSFSLFAQKDSTKVDTLATVVIIKKGDNFLMTYSSSQVYKDTDLILLIVRNLHPLYQQIKKKEEPQILLQNE